MGRGFCQDDWEGKFVGVGCEVIVGESSLLILPTMTAVLYWQSFALLYHRWDKMPLHRWMEPCVQWHFLNKHYLLNLCFMYSLAFNSKVSSSGASGSI